MFNGWFKKNIGVIITIVLLFIGLITSATALKIDQGYLARQVEENCGLDAKQQEDINDIKGDLKEIKAILQRIERKVE